VIGDGQEEKHYNRILTDRQGCGWGQYSADGRLWWRRSGDWNKIFTVSFYSAHTCVMRPSSNCP